VQKVHRGRTIGEKRRQQGKRRQSKAKKNNIRLLWNKREECVAHKEKIGLYSRKPEERKRFKERRKGILRARRMVI